MPENNFLCFVLLFFMLRYALSSALPEANNVAFRSQQHIGGIHHGPSGFRRVKRQNFRIGTNGVTRRFCSMFGCDSVLVPTEKPSPRRSRSYKCKKGERYDRRYRRCRKLV
ncbi:hypothetical protein AVEN_70802-1 [Araneus ventricosus]|uniref:FLYWCH-type domain-containing protein n=1 Tax=Araneus ventricosus TaxID=182803 RepID=A0A4Y2LEU1_ARAVE|nr:hypothetical protein AVEN_229207-1 [Araneus ventricosus]GBN11874.1 hypothetical protein AVEN_241465-1 [Araneus ventricosus]GBN11899.1 hypothetical protein AVEN_15302-1 [Araneus ventricosus]GBN11922.1 hypothetical protein AVEN_70802-1 [Araneus ventricosus]